MLVSLNSTDHVIVVGNEALGKFVHRLRLFVIEHTGFPHLKYVVETLRVYFRLNHIAIQL